MGQRPDEIGRRDPLGADDRVTQPLAGETGFNPATDAFEPDAITPDPALRDEAAPAEVDEIEITKVEIERTRALYAFAETGVPMVRAESRPCLRTAIALYGGILDEIERADYQVLTGRVVVPERRRAAVAVPALVRALAARREAARWRTA